MTVRMRSSEFRQRYPNHFDQKSRPLFKPESENAYQAEVIKWAKDHEAEHPELFLLYAIPNGGRRTRWERAVAVLTGVKSGVPDLCLPVPRHGFVGLFIEMKSEKGRLSPEQKIWIQKLIEQGHKVVTCPYPSLAIGELQRYLDG